MLLSGAPVMQPHLLQTLRPALLRAAAVLYKGLVESANECGRDEYAISQSLTGLNHVICHGPGVTLAVRLASSIGCGIRLSEDAAAAPFGSCRKRSRLERVHSAATSHMQRSFFECRPLRHWCQRTDRGADGAGSSVDSGGCEPILAAVSSGVGARCAKLSRRRQPAARAPSRLHSNGILHAAAARSARGRPCARCLGSTRVHGPHGPLQPMPACVLAPGRFGSADSRSKRHAHGDVCQ